ncbi:transmembrane protein 165 isoform X1 [Diabrotica virgifera virgifera]|uniref:GDT1 family protein n=1 Tax=Diabrotica virgifera virgifera TaxID=50390 RepID=A0ABM5IIN7_DIAVI|nr:transmembrane protein 165 isoform X1 [Diabrotica virgifera virgifera]
MLLPSRRTRFILCILLITLHVLFTSAEIEPNEDDKPTLTATIAPPGSTANSENVGFTHAFVASLSVILVSEIGDKTFFIAAIMAMKHPRLTVFAGAISALILMTVLSAVFGWLVTVIPRAYTYYISTALFAIFGLKMLWEGYHMTKDEGREEFEEVQMELRQREEVNRHFCDIDEQHEATLPDIEIGSSNRRPTKSVWYEVSRILLQSFTLTFLAEWGDRSQLTTILLGARENVYGVIIGGILGHCACTGLAVLGGRMIAQKISVRTVTIIGGVVFLIFAFSALFIDPNAT